MRTAVLLVVVAAHVAMGALCRAPHAFAEPRAVCEPPGYRSSVEMITPSELLREFESGALKKPTLILISAWLSAPYNAAAWQAVEMAATVADTFGAKVRFLAMEADAELPRTDVALRSLHVRGAPALCAVSETQFARFDRLLVEPPFALANLTLNHYGPKPLPINEDFLASFVADLSDVVEREVERRRASLAPTLVGPTVSDEVVYWASVAFTLAAASYWYFVAS
eukprot:a679964_11.p1 GENE.a679964_11~~a679964_11.p1  ORF type:complete len:251 (+),score=54.32 a679964_11:81-755(+)